jgi:energy-coupling factor transport system substrate-specific component
MSNIRTTGKKSSNTLVRDLVNVGIFAALYVVLAGIAASVGFIPAFIIVSTFMVSLVTSVPLFLFFSKVERPLLCCTLLCGFFGVLMVFTGHGISISAIGIVLGIVSGLCLKVFHKSFMGCFLANVTISFLPSSMMIPLWSSTEEYLAYCSSVCDAAYIAHLNELSSSYWPLIGLFVFGALGAVIGGFIARRMMKKHFERIGLVR